MLGVDRDSELCADLFDASGPAVLDMIGQIVGAARKAGITSISVNPDAVPAARAATGSAERRPLLT